jgi:hypothetical protein
MSASLAAAFTCAVLFALPSAAAAAPNLTQAQATKATLSFARYTERIVSTDANCQRGRLATGRWACKSGQWLQTNDSDLLCTETYVVNGPSIHDVKPSANESCRAWKPGY